jgi:hypothetical protein
MATATRKRKADRPTHTVFNFKTGSCECRHCGVTQQIAMPMELRQFTQKLDEFTTTHDKCVQQK